MTEDEMVGKCHRSNQHEFDTTPGDSGRQEGLAGSGPWGHEESDTTKGLNDDDITYTQKVKKVPPMSRFHREAGSYHILGQSHSILDGKSSDDIEVEARL